jgi:hypothetical protein
MKASEEASIPAGLDRIKGLMSWWGMPSVLGAGQIEAQGQRFQGLVVDLVKLFNEASSNQAQALFAANEQFTRAFQDLLRAREPPELMAAQSSLVIGLMQSLAAQTKIWAELTQKLSDYCSTVAHKAVVEAGEHASRSEPAGKQAEAERPERPPKPKADR